MKVLKFGGTSVGTAENLRKVKEILASGKGTKAICVVSALGGVTNMLHDCSEKAAAGSDSYLALMSEIEKRHLDTVKELLPVKSQSTTVSRIKILLNDLEDIMKGVYLIGELSPRTLDKVLSFGETLSSNIIVDFLNTSALETTLADPRQLIITDSNFNNANVDINVTNDKIQKYISTTGDLVVCPGFVSANAEGVTTTLGRGGSDYTAAIFAAALNVDAFEIWTDVSGMMTSDPRQVKEAHPIEKLSFQEALELSHFGAKVIYPPTIQPVLNQKIPIKIKNTFDASAMGTTICEEGGDKSQTVKGLSSVSNISLLNFTGSGMVGIPKFSYRLFKALSEAEVNVIIITQASSEHSICVGIDSGGVEKSKKAIEAEFELELSLKKVDPLEVENGLAIVALVGDNMRDHVGIGGQMFSSLGENGINIKAIAQGSSERNITTVVEEKHLKKALNVLHESFFLSQKKTLNLFMIGIGNVGGTFIEQIAAHYQYLNDNEQVDLRIVGIANSRKMYFDPNGLDLKNWKKSLDDNGETMDANAFIDRMGELNIRNSIFVDNTANADIAGLYDKVLRKSISVVTPNKIACASDYDNYLQLKNTAKQYQAKFYFETNVGAGLPIITTLGDLIKSGDNVTEIHAVLSGSLNFIFNNFQPGVKFSEVVKQAGVEGYTEPDPKIDLSGVDVMRKILILVRESGVKFELDDIQNEAFIPEECMNTKTNEDFYASLEKNDAVFQKMVESAVANNSKLKFVASYKDGKASVGLQEIPKDHPFYILEGKDNIVLFYTNRYIYQPLVIKGAGAGAEVTASGIFADVMRIAHS